jgi:hypothetical protein
MKQASFTAVSKYVYVLLGFSDGRIILKKYFRHTGYENVGWIRLANDMDQ